MHTEASPCFYDLFQEAQSPYRPGILRKPVSGLWGWGTSLNRDQLQLEPALLVGVPG